MAELRISVGSVGFTILAALGVSCGGATDIGTSGTGATSSAGGSTASGGGSVIGGAGGAVGGSAARAYPPTCTVTSQTNGFTTCVEGWTHRTVAETCKSAIPRADYKCPIATSTTCLVDTDCASTPNGFCSNLALAAGCFCQTGCLSDSDCGPGNICQCADPIGLCVGASCRSDAECPGGFCASYDMTAGCGGVGFACTTPEDECNSGADCPAGYCVLSGTHRSCAIGSCAIGRPFLVAGDDRLAAAVKRYDWAHAPSGLFEDICDRAQRTRLSEHYRQVALMEHASVAAFARLALQLMSLGAPPELLHQAIVAQGDELEHAKIAFGLACELSGGKEGPSALAIDGALDESSIEQIAFTAVVEGCVGETVAAVEAAEASTRASNPELGAELARIARDETRHAQLAYRVVTWLLEVGGEGVRRAVERGFHAAIERPVVPRGTRPEDANCGALDDELAAEVRTQTLRHIIAPAAARLGFDVALYARGCVAKEPGKPGSKSLNRNRHLSEQSS